MKCNLFSCFRAKKEKEEVPVNVWQRKPNTLVDRVNVVYNDSREASVSQVGQAHPVSQRSRSPSSLKGPITVIVTPPQHPHHLPGAVVADVVAPDEPPSPSEKEAEKKEVVDLEATTVADSPRSVN